MTMIMQQSLAIMQVLMISALLGLVLNMVITYLAIMLRPTARHRVVLNGALALYFGASLLTFSTVAQFIRHESDVRPIPILGWMAIVVLVAGLAAAVIRRRVRFALLGAMMLIYNGAVASALGSAYVTVYLLVQFALIGLAAHALVLLWRYGLATVTNLSVKDAFDLIPDGLVFTDSSGNALMTNTAMDEILSATGISMRATGPKLWATISERGTPVSDRQDPSVLLRAENGDAEARAWLMTRTLVAPNGAPSGLGICHQILGTEVSALNSLASQLRAEVSAQQVATQELREALESTDELSRALAREVSRGRVHDLIAQRISIIRRFVEDRISDSDALASLAAMITDLRTELATAPAVGPHVLWAMLKRAYATADFSINATGSLPKDHDTALTFVQIVRQACANAILHASATSVDVVFTSAPDGEHMTVSNPGPAPTAITEGNGIATMRRRLARLGGDLTITTTGLFTLHAFVPTQKDEKPL